MVTESVIDYYPELYKDICKVCEKYDYSVREFYDSFHITRTIKNDYIDFFEGVCLTQFPSNCAWIIAHNFNVTTSFKLWIDFIIEIATLGEYAGVLFSMNESQMQLLDEEGKIFLKECKKLVSQNNPHSWQNVYLFLYPLQEVNL